MDYSFLKNAYQMAHIPFSTNEPLKQHNTFKIQATAALFVKPQNTQQFQSAIAGAAAAEYNFFVLGGGSNIVFTEPEFQGIIISTENLNSITMTDDLPSELPQNKVLVTCQSGTPTATFVKFCTDHCLSGAEQFAGLPGTIGGAVYMNARCFEKSISDILYQTEHLEFSDPVKSKIITMDFNPKEWSYKQSPFQQKKSESDSTKRFITSATFCLTKITADQKPQLESDCKKYITERVEKGHFKFPSAGSVFKNNHSFGSPSGKIIDQAGLRGYQIGGAQVAPFHGNFIINTGSATGQQIKQLVEYVQKVVQEKTGHLLEPEIIFL